MKHCGEIIRDNIRQKVRPVSYTHLDVYKRQSLNYDRAFGDHRVSGLFLFNQQQKLLYPKGTLEDAIPYRMMGIAGRATYSWTDRYFAEFNIGYNGAENFSPKNRYGTFPAYGVGWVISNEKFWEPLSKVVSFLKIRYTDGKVGNSDVSDRRFMYLNQMKENGDYGYKPVSYTHLDVYKRQLLYHRFPKV